MKRLLSCVSILIVCLAGCAGRSCSVRDSRPQDPSAPDAPVTVELRTFAYDCDDSTYVVASFHRASDGLWLGGAPGSLAPHSVVCVARPASRGRPLQSLVQEALTTNLPGARW